MHTEISSTREHFGQHLFEWALASSKISSLGILHETSYIKKNINENVCIRQQTNVEKIGSTLAIWYFLGKKQSLCDIRTKIQNSNSSLKSGKLCISAIMLYTRISFLIVKSLVTKTFTQ